MNCVTNSVKEGYENPIRYTIGTISFGQANEPGKIVTKTVYMYMFYLFK